MGLDSPGLCQVTVVRHVVGDACPHVATIGQTYLWPPMGRYLFRSREFQHVSCPGEPLGSEVTGEETDTGDDSDSESAASDDE